LSEMAGSHEKCPVDLDVTGFRLFLRNGRLRDI
jgi:hypothetical protein